MNKIKIPLSVIHTVFGLCGAWIFLGNDYVSYRVGMFLTKSPDVYQLLTNLFAFAVLYSPFAFFLCAYLILRNKIFFRGRCVYARHWFTPYPLRFMAQQKLPSKDLPAASQRVATPSAAALQRPCAGTHVS